MLDLNRLRTFRAVLAAGSVQGAATNLGYSSSAVSQQLHTLQRETGLELIERRGRGIAATAAGLRLGREIEPLLAQAGRIEALADDLREGRTGSLTVSHIASVGAAWVPSIAAVLTREFPDVRLDLRLQELAHGAGELPDVEIGLDDPRVPLRPGFDAIELLTEPYIAVLRDDHPLASREEVALADLAGESWIDNDITRGLCRQLVLDACAANGFVPDFRLETQDYATAMAFVEVGGGVTVMPRLGLLSSPVPRRVVAVPIAEPAPRRTLGVQIRAGVRRNPVVRRLLELLGERAAEARAI